MSSGGSGQKPYMDLLGGANYQKLLDPAMEARSQSKDPSGLVGRTQFIKNQQPKPGQGTGPLGPTGKGGINYQTGFNANDQAINEGNILGRLAAEGGGPKSQFSGVNDLRKSQQANDAAQVRRGVQQENAQANMNDQVARSELLQSAVSNMSKVYGDMTQRSIDQMGLANQLQQAMIRNRSALFQALTG